MQSTSESWLDEVATYLHGACVCQQWNSSWESGALSTLILVQEMEAAGITVLTTRESPLIMTYKHISPFWSAL